MIDFSHLIQVIKDNGGFQPNSSDSSYYRTYTMQGSKPIQIRISNHGTHLWTWYDRDYDPSAAINLCVVFSENGSYDSNTTVDMRIKNGKNVVGQRKTFEVIQYVYNCQLLDDNDSVLINQAIQSLWRNKQFIDPLAGTPKHAKVMRLKPNESIEMITENKQYKHNRNMKQTIRLNENDIKRMVMEAINELDWKTAVNAAKKAEEKGDPRKGEFLKYAMNRLKSQYPNRTHLKDFPDTYSQEEFNPYLNTRYGYLNGHGEIGDCDYEYHKSFGDKGVKGYGKFHAPGRFGSHDYSVDGNPDSDVIDNTDWEPMSKDMEDYYTGKTRYEKGKGWITDGDKLDESITRAIRKLLR